MPLLPQNLVDYLSAPVPFVAGIHRSYLPTIDLPDDVLFCMSVLVSAVCGAVCHTLCVAVWCGLCVVMVWFAATCLRVVLLVLLVC